MRNTTIFYVSIKVLYHSLLVLYCMHFAIQEYNHCGRSKTFDIEKSYRLTPKALGIQKWAFCKFGRLVQITFFQCLRVVTMLPIFFKVSYLVIYGALWRSEQKLWSFQNSGLATHITNPTGHGQPCIGQAWHGMHIHAHAWPCTAQTQSIFKRQYYLRVRAFKKNQLANMTWWSKSSPFGFLKFHVIFLKIIKVFLCCCF
jgi:hypothetical protein